MSFIYVPPTAGGGMASSWTGIVGPITAQAGFNYAADTSGGAFTVTLPGTPSSLDAVYFQDAAGTWNTNALTIGRNGNTIMGVAEDLVANTKNTGFGLIYNGSDWRTF